MQGLLDLASRFAAGEVAASRFDDLYRHQFSKLPLGVPDDTFIVLEELAFACEDYVEDPAIRIAEDLDEQRLREAARRALVALSHLLRPEEGEHRPRA